MASSSPFLNPSARSRPGDLAIVLLARDSYQPITLEQSTGVVDGYVEGKVLNTRFGSFPHSTFLDVPWGSQIRASHVDTGSRGRKRKLEASGEDTSIPGADDETKDSEAGNQLTRKAASAPSGFVHILKPSPELWTSALPHRTQVVYTPDYSYILSRIRARPGTRIIEAGAGSGSFTHASVRAVYNGLPQKPEDKKGKVFSFEFNEDRYHKMQDEIFEHKLADMVHLTHRDVYGEGFLVEGKSPEATAIFLDLPAPWKALKHISRRRPQKDGETPKPDNGDWISPLDPKKSVHICTFSPCIEQVMRTVTELRRLGWVDVDMVEVAHKRINVLREKVGLNLPNKKGCNLTPANVMESIDRLKVINEKTKDFNNAQKEKDGDAMAVDPSDSGKANGREEEDEKPWAQGRVVHRPEGELKTHTSYLVFAVLPREWSEEDEAAASAKWPCGKETKTIGSVDKAARKQAKRELHHMYEMEKGRKRQKRSAGEKQAIGEVTQTST
ncbi:uncharacterized protein J7T54_008120 [Emericellopsis cladophorae]|uniref:tRNA (adenine(58)-N(1))-methyltransferase catalytic subunit TRM61 n=1 Tax=Emericellopsis cladophorae TaxID=2686198 RepID=A0A9P9Y7S7_9HYPO|nr:uncharacterized protein J7T54_008120 [Emericellopsis cladophorae]KAI6785026.1 hypothetical protein J7T54_008120 [Emericellopsis cladophorae]